MFARVSAPASSLLRLASFALGAMVAGCSSASPASESPPNRDDSGLGSVDAATGVDARSGGEALDAGMPESGPGSADAGAASADAEGVAFGPAGDAGVLAFCTSFCSFARQCAAGSDGGSAADGGAPCDCQPASLSIQRADYVADITSCLAGLDAGACGDASGSASDCVGRAGATLEPSPNAVSFCKVDEVSTCPLRGCLTLVGLYGDPTVEKFPACLPDAAPPSSADGGCDDFKACLSAALTP